MVYLGEVARELERENVLETSFHFSFMHALLSLYEKIILYIHIERCEFKLYMVLHYSIILLD